MTGRQFGRWNVLSLDYIDKEKDYKIYWKCKCSCEKHTVKSIDGHTLRYGGSKSCGCLRSEKSKIQGKKNKIVDRFLPLSKRLYYDYKIRCAQNRNHEFDIELTSFRKKILEPCYYCGELPSREYHHPKTSGSFLYNGLDRVNNDLGYTEENVVTCCFLCNSMKKAMSQKDFLSWVKRVYNHSIKGKDDQISK